MDVLLGSLQAQLERPQTRKFSLPIVLLPELFASPRHLIVLIGYLVSIGWEVYALDPHQPAPPKGGGTQASALCAAVALVNGALSAIGTDVIVVGHGLGGLLALKAAERPPVRAAVALAPALPGLQSPLAAGTRRRHLRWRAAAQGLPPLRVLTELVGEAEPFQRDAIIKTLVPADLSAAQAVERREVEFATGAAPRLIIVGSSDRFAPRARTEQFAQQIDAQCITLEGRGHWLVAGKVLERVIAQIQRFLVQALGEQLLLLYAENYDPDRDE